MKRGMRGPPEPEREAPKRSQVKCCLCGECVLMSGWCDNCQRWPINITPHRWCDRGHPVDPDGLCFQCNTIVLTRLEPKTGEWVDTGVVNRPLSKAENHARLKELMASLKDVGSFKRPRPGLKITPEKRAELAREHAQVRERIQEAETEVPF